MVSIGEGSTRTSDSVDMDNALAEAAKLSLRRTESPRVLELLEREKVGDDENPAVEAGREKAKKRAVAAN